MKRFVPFIVATALLAATMTGCGAKAPTPTPAATPAPTAAATPAPAPTAAATPAPAASAAAPAAAGAVKTGLGIVTSVGNSKAATASAAGVAQFDSTMAVVTLDASGKIVKCSIDGVRAGVNFDAKGVVSTDVKAEVKSKDELGTAYGMGKASKVGKEWNQQAQAFADWTIGKTEADIKGLKLKKVDDAHPAVPDEADLSTSVTLSVGDFMTAIEKAITNAQSSGVAPSGDIKTGLGIVTSVASSKPATASAAGLAQADSLVAAVTVDASGKIVECSFDAAQTKVSFDATGVIKTDVKAPIQSKDELGAAYGMVKASKIGKEWNQQAEAFAKWAIGKTAADLKGVTLKPGEGAPDVADLATSVTIGVGDFIKALDKAVANAK